MLYFSLVCLREQSLSNGETRTEEIEQKSELLMHVGTGGTVFMTFFRPEYEIKLQEKLKVVKTESGRVAGTRRISNKY